MVHQLQNVALAQSFVVASIVYPDLLVYFFRGCGDSFYKMVALQYQFDESLLDWHCCWMFLTDHLQSCQTVQVMCCLMAWS